MSDSNKPLPTATVIERDVPSLPDGGLPTARERIDWHKSTSVPVPATEKPLAPVIPLKKV